jgi:hypothetical protein
MSNSTNLDDLPVGDQNVKMETVEKPAKQMLPANEIVDNNLATNSQQPVTANAMSNENINELVNGLQTANAAGLLDLPSRDIPQSQEHLQTDETIQANYIAPSIGNDYILEHQTNEDIIRKNAENVKNQNKNDELFNEIQNPLIIGILYFLFQLPIVKKNAFKYLPKLFHSDGNYNFLGHLITSLLFASSFFGINKGLFYFSE